MDLQFRSYGDPTWQSDLLQKLLKSIIKIITVGNQFDVIGKGAELAVVLNKLFIKTLYHLNAKRLFGQCGKGTYIIKPLRIINGKMVQIGERVSILHFLRLETYLIENNTNPIISIGDDTNIEQNVHITAGKMISIGCACSILGGAIITDINHLYEDINVPASKQPMKCKPVMIGNQCFIGMHAMITPGVTLGNHVIVGANSVVTQSFPDNCVVAGVPAKMIKKFNRTTGTWVKC